MANEKEPAKLLLPYLQRADELQKHEPLVAYYCRLYAMERGLKIPQSERTKTTNALLVSLMSQLEKDKKSLKLGPDDNLYLEGFASNVFAKADKQDRAGRADLNTAKTFYAASIFFEIINQFGGLQPDLEQKQKYAAWKAVDIRKALKEGRIPVAGPPAGDEDLSMPPGTPGGSYVMDQEKSGQVTNPGAGFVSSPQFHDELSLQHSMTGSHSELHRQHSINQFHHEEANPHSTSAPRPPPPCSTGNFPSHDYHPPPDNSIGSQAHHRQPYIQEPQNLLPRNHPSSYSYPNFQTYPGFSESSLPEVPSHYPSYYKGGSDGSYASQPAAPPPPPIADYSPTTRYNNASGMEEGSVSDPFISPAQAYKYDSNYQPPPEKVAEAHRSARFAVGALAFDDVAVAVDFLQKSLELLTNPSAESSLSGGREFDSALLQQRDFIFEEIS